MLTAIFFLLFSFTIAFNPGQQDGCCSYGDLCWPSEYDIQILEKQFDATKRRLIRVDDQPFPSAVPIFSPDDQPLFGAGANLSAVYVQPENQRETICTEFDDEYCQISTRNLPRENATPAFVVWPTTAKEVQAAIKFAFRHRLCVSVAGTGHDFHNRHSNHQSLFIRTSLMKSMDFNLCDRNEFQHKYAKLGPGLTFSEIQQAASVHGKMIVSGWSPSVGIIGWSISGGHGLGAPMHGLGVDNILEVDVVLASGLLITVNAKEHSDLYWAIRGGGGSTWGVITSITVRLHDFPSSGINSFTYSWAAPLCDDGLQQVNTAVDNYLDVALNLGTKWTGIVIYETQRIKEPAINCDAGIGLSVIYHYFGSTSDDEFVKTKHRISMLAPNPISNSSNHFTNIYDVNKKNLEYIYATQVEGNIMSGVIAGRDVVANGKMGSLFKETFLKCKTEGKCGTGQWHHDITGNIGSPQDCTSAIGAGFRSGLFNVVVGGKEPFPELEELGANSYFSESAYEMKDWKERYWGKDIYEKLLKVKQAYDPSNFFWCRHCVGSESPRDNTISIE